MASRWLILETSRRVGQVALADDETVLAARSLDEARRHARDLVPAVKDLLAEQGWRPADLTGVMVGRGPGSYTGLRVGLMSAKTLAYATGCALVAVDSFAALAWGTAGPLDVIADAQQDHVYVQRYHDGRPLSELAIRPAADWLAELTADVRVTGPGLERFAARLPPGTPTVADAPGVEGLLRVGLERWRRGERDDPFAVEPLYLRPSAAETQWQRLGRA